MLERFRSKKKNCLWFSKYQQFLFLTRYVPFIVCIFIVRQGLGIRCWNNIHRFIDISGRLYMQGCDRHRKIEVTHKKAKRPDWKPVQMTPHLHQQHLPHLPGDKTISRSWRIVEPLTHAVKRSRRYVLKELCEVRKVTNLTSFYRGILSRNDPFLDICLSSFYFLFIVVTEPRSTLCS